jgi:hypothetical protein
MGNAGCPTTSYCRLVIQEQDRFRQRSGELASAGRVAAQPLEDPIAVNQTPGRSDVGSKLAVLLAGSFVVARISEQPPPQRASVTDARVVRSSGATSLRAA